MAIMARYKGIFPVVPTPFTKEESLDLEGQKRILDCMIAQQILRPLIALKQLVQQFLAYLLHRASSFKGLKRITCLHS